MQGLKKIYHQLLIVIKDEIKQELEQKFGTSEVNADDLSKPMTSKEVCAYYKISPSTLERYVRNGLKHRSSGKNTKRLFTKKEFENYLKNKNHGKN